MAQRILRIANPPLSDELRTYLRSDVSASGTALPVSSTSGFVVTGTADYYVLVGKYGEEKAEICTVDANGGSTNATSFTVGALSFSHEASDPVSFMRFNKIQIYGAPTLTGTKTLITTVSIDPSEQATAYTYSDDVYVYFFVKYYNDIGSGQASDYSEAITTGSFGRHSAKRIIESGLRKAHTAIDHNEDGQITWDVALEVLGDGLDEIQTRKRKWQGMHTRSTGTFTTANTAYIDKPSDMGKMDFLIVNNYRLEWMSPLQYNDNTQAGTIVSVGEPRYYTEIGNQFYLYPTPGSAYAVIFDYWKNYGSITLATDIIYEFVVMLTHFCAAHFAWIRGNDKVGEREYALFLKILEQQVEEFTGPHQFGESEMVELTSDVNLDEI
jgi:hypothetical protein